MCGDSWLGSGCLTLCLLVSLRFDSGGNAHIFVHAGNAQDTV